MIEVVVKLYNIEDNIYTFNLTKQCNADVWDNLSNCIESINNDGFKSNLSVSEHHSNLMWFSVYRPKTPFPLQISGRYIMDVSTSEPNKKGYINIVIDNIRNVPVKVTKYL